MARSSGSQTVDPLRDSTRVSFNHEQYDAIGRIKTSQSQSMIDTDFEYGLQPTRWMNTQRVNGNFIDPVSGRLTYSGTSSTILKRATWQPLTVFSQEDYIFYGGTSQTAYKSAIVPPSECPIRIASVTPQAAKSAGRTSWASLLKKLRSRSTFSALDFPCPKRS